MQVINLPVITERLINVFKTSFVRYEYFKDVSETVCAHWIRACRDFHDVIRYNNPLNARRLINVCTL